MADVSPQVHAVAISGSPRVPSKSKTLAELMLAALEGRGCATAMVDVAELPAEALLARASAAEIDAAIAQVGRAQIVIAATPTYRALYTGAMKCLFDLMPPAHLAAKICIPIQTGAAPQHFLSVEYGLRPLFTSLEGLPIAGLYTTDDQFVDGKPGEKVLARIKMIADLAVSMVRRSAD
jgi:FMN reductase